MTVSPFGRSCSNSFFVRSFLPRSGRSGRRRLPSFSSSSRCPPRSSFSSSSSCRNDNNESSDATAVVAAPSIQQYRRQHRQYRLQSQHHRRWFGSNSVKGVGNGTASASTDAQQQQENSNSNNAANPPFYGLPRRPAVRSATSSSSDSDDCYASRTARTMRLLADNASIALKDPTRADAVAAVGELTGLRALRRLLEKMQRHPVGRIILVDRPVVSKTTIPYERLVREAETIKRRQHEEYDTGSPQSSSSITFGQAYGMYLAEHGFDPDSRDGVRYVENPDLAYVMLRYRQCHDYWHALTGVPPTVEGELGLKWLELFQTGLPMTALSSAVASFLVSTTNDNGGDDSTSRTTRNAVWNVYLPWAVRVSRNLNNMSSENGGGGTGGAELMMVYYEKEFDTPLDELRTRLGIEPAPQVP